MAFAVPDDEQLALQNRFLQRLLTEFVGDPEMTEAAFRMAVFLANAHVWTYSGPDDRGRRFDETAFCRRVARIKPRKWPSFWQRFQKFVIIEEGDPQYVRLHADAYVIFAPIAATRRAKIPTGIKYAVETRDGRMCAYCGNPSGPFQFDHLHPRSRGGTDAPNNLVLACQACNLDKSDLTLREWIGK